MDNEQKKCVAVIGAGPSGLLAIKYALDYGFQPCGFQRNDKVGGVWNPQTGAVWKQMTTNISKYTCSFTGFPWPDQSPIYPSSGSVMEYLNNYAKKYNLLKFINFNTEVVTIDKKTENQKTYYIVTYRQNQEVILKKFQFVVIASGIFSVPVFPQLKGSKQFKGKIMHSKTYKHGEVFKDKKILIIGGSFTGVQLASNIAKYAKKVVHSFKKPFWIIPHFIGPIDKKFPMDFLFTRQFYLEEKSKSPNLDKNSRYSKTICKQQQQLKELKIDQQYFQHPIYFAISSDYIQSFKNQKIFPIKSTLSKLEGNNVYLTLVNDKGQKLQEVIEQDVDEIILCTGYTSSLKFLSKEIMDILLYDQTDRSQPIILYKQMYHPQLENMFFIGMYKGPFFPIFQLQVKAAFQYFTNKAKVPSKEQIQKYLNQLKQKRQSKIRPQSPHPDYVNFADGLAQFAGNNLQLAELIKYAKIYHEQQLQKDEKATEQTRVAKDFFKMTVFPCIPQAFTTNGIQNQIKSTSDLIKSFFTIKQDKQLQ